MFIFLINPSCYRDIGTLDYGFIEIGNSTFLGNTSHKGSFGAIVKNDWITIDGKDYYADIITFF